MGGIAFSGFVCDEDSQHLAASFPMGLVATLEQVGITVGKGTPDECVVRHAREHGRIIVTGNKSHFCREMTLAAERCTPYECYEGGGMITVPGGLERIPFHRISRKLVFNGQQLDWHDVFLCNLHVSVQRDGTIMVKALPLCEFFKRDHVAECQRCALLGIAG